MTNSDSDGLFDNDWEDRGELAWTELDWQKYLDTQEAAVREYIKHYDQLPEAVDRVDEAARRMGWELAETPENLELEDERDEETEEVSPATGIPTPCTATRFIFPPARSM